MSPTSVAFGGLQALLGLVGLVVGGAKVTGQAEQIEAFRRYGYPQWFRVGTGAVEIGAGAALVAGLLWLPALTPAGGALLSAVMAGAITTHLRIGDPLSEAAAPAALLLLSLGLLAQRSLSVVS